MALLDVLANVFTAGALGTTRAAAGLAQGARFEVERLQDGGSSAFDCAGLPPFQLQDGFLLETDAGRVWRYDEERDAFIELRFLPAPVEEGVSADVLVNQIEKTENEIERILRDIPDQQKQAIRSALNENYKKARVWALVQSRALTAQTSTMAAR